MVNKVDHAEFEFMNYSNHHSQITGLDVCIRKPLIATCSTDKSVRIWNFETGYLYNRLDKFMRIDSFHSNSILDHLKFIENFPKKLLAFLCIHLVYTY